MSYQTRPEDIYVLDPSGRQLDPPEGRVSGWLRRYRLRLALGLGLVEAIVLWSLHSWFFGSLVALVVAILSVFAYMRFGRSLRQGTLRHLFWIVAFGQGIAALVPALVGFVAFSLIAFAVIVLLVLLMVLLGR